MEAIEFLNNFTDQFDESDLGEVSLETAFRDIEGWSSLAVLSIIAMVDESYNVKLTGEDIRKAVTILDLFNIVNSRS
jgi:acyl carrier protein